MKKNIFKNLIALTLAAILCASFTGCNKETYDDYSIGLDSNGYYKTLDENKKDISYSGLKLKTQELLEWGAKNSSSDSGTKSVDEYIKAYAKELLINVGAANKETAEVGDSVKLLLDFYIGDKQLNEFYGEKSFTITKDSDSIVRGAVGHKVNDEYEAEYTFDKDDKDYGSQKANVKVKVVEVLYGDPLNDDLIKEHIDKITAVIPDAKDVDSLLVNIRPKLAEALLIDYVSDYIQNDESVKVPQEYVDCELYRLKARLNKVGYTYKEYLKTSKTTDADTVKQCEKFARESYIIMLRCKQKNVTVSDNDITTYFGDNKENAVNVQGMPYMKLTILREMGLLDIAKELTLLDDNGEKIDLSLYDESAFTIKTEKESTSSTSSPSKSEK